MFAKLSLRHRLVSMSLFSATVLLGIVGFAHIQLESIGRDVSSIVERDMPLKDLVVQVTVHQFDAAISIERALHYGVEMATNPSSAERFEGAIEDFGGYAEKIRSDFVELKALSAAAMSQEDAARSQIDFARLNNRIEGLETTQAGQVANAQAAFDALRAGNIRAADELGETMHETGQWLQEETQSMLAMISAAAQASAKVSHDRQVQSEIALWGGGVLIALISVGLSLLFAQFTAKPLMNLKNVMNQFAAGDYGMDVPYLQYGGEIGEMARAVNTLKDGSKNAEKMRVQRLQEAEERQEEARQTMLDLANALEETLETSVRAVANKTKTMRDNAQRMGEAATNVSTQAVTVASASEQASNNVATVASAAEELASIASDINTNVTQSAEVAQNAVETARATNTSVKGLTEAAGKIGDVVSLINEIAEQTNLLALNATIEAARAGEHGKGFAVVATEVKNLANQTARATADIGQQVQSIRDATSGAVEAIEAIGETVMQLDERARVVASSVEQQEAATREIAMNAQQLSEGTKEVTTSINEVSSASGQTRDLAQEVSSASGEISNSMVDLQQNLKHVLRTSSAGNRRASVRADVDIVSYYNSGGSWRPCRILNIARIGAFVTGIDDAASGMALTLRIPDVGEIDSVVTQIDDKGCGVTYQMDEEDIISAFEARFGAYLRDDDEDDASADAQAAAA